MVGVALMKTPRDNPRSCEMSGSSRIIAAAGWLSQVGGNVVYVAQADLMAENNASLGTRRHSSGLSSKLHAAETLDLRRQEPALHKAALAHLWCNATLVAQAEVTLVCNCLKLVQEVMIRLS
jgi:hypothetical protein